jgi:hypothetical protein
MDSDMTDEKVRENKARRMARRQGLRLIKSRRRDPYALDYGHYWLADISTNLLLIGGEWGVSLDEIEAWLTGEDDHGIRGPTDA